MKVLIASMAGDILASLENVEPGWTKRQLMTMLQREISWSPLPLQLTLLHDATHIVGDITLEEAGVADGSRITLIRQALPRILITGASAARLVDVSGGAPPVLLRPAEGEVIWAACAPSGLVALTVTGGVQAWNAESGACICSLDVEGAFFGTFSCDSELAITCHSGGVAQLWAVASWERLSTLSGHRGDVYAACFSPDGNIVVTAVDNTTVKIWSVLDGACLRTLRGQRIQEGRDIFLSDGQHIVTTSEKVAKIWSTASKSCVLQLQGNHEDLLLAEACGGGKYVLTLTFDGLAIVFDASSGNQMISSDPTDRVYDAAVGPYGDILCTVHLVPSTGAVFAKGCHIRSLNVLWQVHLYFGCAIFLPSFSPTGDLLLVWHCDDVEEQVKVSFVDTTAGLLEQPCCVVQGESAILARFVPASST